MFRVLLLFIVVALMAPCTTAYCDGCTNTSTPAPGIAEFFRAIAGQWIGVCKQSTDNEPADDKYFRAIIKESSPGLFEAHFDYYRVGDNGALQHIGSSNVTATISAAGATGRVLGDGEVLVDQKVKRQEHDLTETMTATGTGIVTARGSGSLKVSGMPLGLGKLGKVKDDQSSWSLSNGTLTVHQSMSIVFKALFLSKSFKVDASYTAVRGADVATLLPKPGGAPATTGAGPGKIGG